MTRPLGMLGAAALRQLLLAALCASSAHAATTAPPSEASRDVVPRALALALERLHRAPSGRDTRERLAMGIPSYSRQTKLACSACHYQFFQLTPFGRLFKLNGYTLTGLQSIEERAPSDTSRRELQLSPIPLVSAMAIASVTNVRSRLPGTQNNTTTFPDQLSIFLGGEITPRIGVFSQFTYAAPDASVGIDNVDIRFANRATIGKRGLLYGITLHNNPTVQDVWNTVPAWGYPYVSSPVAPSPAASALIDGPLGQQVIGLGAYGLWSNTLYTEFTAYRSAPQGGAQPADASAENTTRGIIPYWRVALQRQIGRSYLMIGSYGFAARLFPTGVSGPTDRYTDVAGDAQIEQPIGRGVLIARSTYIHEHQRLDALADAETPGAANRTNDLNTFRVNATYEPSLRAALSIGYFDITGSRDTLLFAPAPVTGSANGRPNSNGLIGELDINPWENTRLGAQYVWYNRFNGSTSAYDGSGRDASRNNTLYLFTWLAF
ncbi:MAG TPA: hypothetical protein VFS44_06615 [Gemmatimonadaceae bacterium]|nr:hypothetical protein [Gemmatimonadaceae bacterium]